MSPAGRLSRFEEYRYVGTRDDMRVYDCDDADQLARLAARVADEGLVAAKMLQAFAPDTFEEAANRGFRGAVPGP